MPLFIFISGRFSHVNDKDKYKIGIYRLLETYLVFQIIRTLTETALGKELTIECITVPNYMLWYLVALIYWRLVICYLPSTWLLYRYKLLIVSLFICLAAGFIPIGYPFVVQRALTFQFFFFLGYYSVDVDMKKYISRIPAFVALLFIIVTVASLYFVVDISLGNIHHCSIPYWNRDMTHTLYRFFSRCIYLPFAILLCLAIMRIAPPPTTHHPQQLCQNGGNIRCLSLSIIHFF